MSRGRCYGPIFGGVCVGQIASRCLVYSIDSADFTTVWKRAGNMFVAIHIRSLANGLSNTVHSGSHVAFRNPTPIIAVAVAERRGTMGNHGRHWTEHGNYTSSERVSVDIIHEILNFCLNSFHVTKGIHGAHERRVP
jgi:hypothetical protein